MLAGGAIGLVLPLPQQQVLNLDPLNRFKEPHLALDLKPRSGPIAIMIEYVIRHEDEAEFLATMAERGRIRRRDGARNWTLARDLENPDNMDRALPHADLARICQAQWPHHPCRRHGRRALAGAAQRRGTAARAPRHRAPDDRRHSADNGQGADRALRPDAPYPSPDRSRRAFSSSSA